MKSLFKQLGAALILASFLVVVLFSSAVMTHEPDGDMAGNCPFPATGSSVCPPGAASVAIHHISAFNDFLNVSVSFGLSMIVSLLLLVCVLFVYFTSLSLPEPPSLRTISEGFPLRHSSEDKKTRWLSLLENSPAHI